MVSVRREYISIAGMEWRDWYSTAPVDEMLGKCSYVVQLNRICFCNLFKATRSQQHSAEVVVSAYDKVGFEIFMN